MSLNRTTIRALAASVAMFTAGGTVAAAAVFHLPVLGFDAAGASSPTAQVEPVATVHAKPVVPLRVVKTRVVTEIVHHHAAAASMPAPAAPFAVPAPAASVSSTSGTTAPSAPVAQQPTSPTGGGYETDDGHEDGHDGHGGSEDVPSPTTGQPAGGTQVGQ